MSGKALNPFNVLSFASFAMAAAIVDTAERVCVFCMLAVVLLKIFPK